MANNGKIIVEEECWACKKVSTNVKQNICDECQRKADEVVAKVTLAAKCGDYSKVQRLMSEYYQMRKRTFSA